uniref:Ubiquitin-like protein ATG12 n=1 Tax=Zonotrichia albicollis TaxID=44394 RepID=A0A8D2MI54_ZONAL
MLFSSSCVFTSSAISQCTENFREERFCSGAPLPRSATLPAQRQQPDSGRAAALTAAARRAKAVGDTPIMRTKKWAVERTRTIQGLVDFIKKFLKLMASEQLFIYVNQSFAPSPDQEVGTLYECFGSDGKLVLHYCKTQAWG